MALVVKDLTRAFHLTFLEGRILGDEWGPELVVGMFDSRTNEFHGGFVGDNTSLCTGGARIWNGGIRYETNPEILKLSFWHQLDRLHRHLARPMTIKHLWCYPINSPPAFGYWGGGKAKIVQGSYQDRNLLITDWTRAMSEFRVPDGRKLLGQAFIGGADAGLNEQDLKLICEVNGSNKCVTGGPGYIQYETLGVTGLILVHAAKILAEFCGFRWNESFTFSVAGLGQVGKGVLQWLVKKEYQGPLILAVSDKKIHPQGEAIRNHNGLQPAEVLRTLEDHERGILSLVGKKGTKEIACGLELFDLARALVLAVSEEEVIHAGNARRVRSPIVLSGTNSGITEGGYKALHDRGILAPLDAMVNMGAASVAKSNWHGLPEDECVALAKRAVEENLRWALGKSGKHRSMDQVARDEAYRRLEPLS